MRDIDFEPSRYVAGFSSLSDRNELRKLTASFDSSFLTGNNDRRRAFSSSIMKKGQQVGSKHSSFLTYPPRKGPSSSLVIAHEQRVLLDLSLPLMPLRVLCSDWVVRMVERAIR